VQHELAIETQKTQQEALHPRVPPPIELFVVRPSITRSQSSQFSTRFDQKNPLLAAELERVGARKPLAAIDTSRYQLTLSSATPSSDEEWKSALDGACTQLEHQRIRYCYSTPRLVVSLAKFIVRKDTIISHSSSSTEAMHGAYITTYSRRIPRER
jgi:hypothetical protein